MHDDDFDRDDAVEGEQEERPENLEALLLVERLIGSAMRAPAVFDRLKIAGVTAAEFEKQKHGEMLTAMIEVEKRHGRVEPTMVGAYLRETMKWTQHDVRSWINAAVEAGGETDDDTIGLAIERVRYGAGIRRLKDMCNRFSDDLRARRRSITEITGDFTRECEDIVAGTTTRSKAINGPQLMRKMSAEREAEKKAFIRVPTGMGPLDRMMRGGYRTGRMFVYGADMGQGKTTFLCLMVLSALRAGHRVVVITFEADDTEIGEVLVEMIAGVRRDDVRTASESARIAEAEAFIAASDLVLECIESATVEELVAKMQAERRAFDAKPQPKGKAIVLMVDYFQDIDRSTRFSRDDLNYAHISKSLRKGYARYDIAGVVLSQLGDPKDPKTALLNGPGVNQMAYTKQLPKDAAYVAVGDRPADDDDEVKANTTRVKLGKNRPDKETGRAHMRYNKRTTQLLACDANGNYLEPELITATTPHVSTSAVAIRFPRPEPAMTSVALNVGDDDGWGPRR